MRYLFYFYFLIYFLKLSLDTIKQNEKISEGWTVDMFAPFRWEIFPNFLSSHAQASSFFFFTHANALIIIIFLGDWRRFDRVNLEQPHLFIFSSKKKKKKDKQQQNNKTEIRVFFFQCEKWIIVKSEKWNRYQYIHTRSEF